jgi:hypothetical protein
MSNVGKGTLIKSSVVCVMGKCRTLIRGYVRRLPESPVFSVTPGCVPLPTFRLARYSCIFRVTDGLHHNEAAFTNDAQNRITGALSSFYV